MSDIQNCQVCQQPLDDPKQAIHAGWNYLQKAGIPRPPSFFEPPSKVHARCIPDPRLLDNRHAHQAWQTASIERIQQAVARLEKATLALPEDIAPGMQEALEEIRNHLNPPDRDDCEIKNPA